MSLRLVEVNPGSDAWEAFIRMTYEYFKETWPRIVENIDISNFCLNYGKTLVARYYQSERYIMFIESDGKRVGLSNIFRDRGDFCIAEFYIIPAERHQGFGRKAFQEIKKFIREKGGNRIIAEVNQDLSVANKFWSVVGMRCTRSDHRNVYET